jgi:hypothetical protein
LSPLPEKHDVEKSRYFQEEGKVFGGKRKYFNEKIDTDSTYAHLFQLSIKINDYAETYHDSSFENPSFLSILTKNTTKKNQLKIRPALSKALHNLESTFVNLLYVNNEDVNYEGEFFDEFDVHKTAAKDNLYFKHSDLRLYNKPNVDLQKSPDLE